MENRPDWIYYPTHVEGMEMAGMARDGRYRIAVTYSFPHRFWTVDGDRTTKVELGSDDTVHLMLTAWDAETGRVLPASNQQVTVTRDGTTHVDRSLWRMLSQNMGVHFGDNVSLDGDGTYEVAVRFGPLEETLTGGLAGAFAEPASVRVPMEFSQSTLETVSFRRLGDREGTRGAISPMEMDTMPVAGTPAPEDVPGEPLGTVESGDVVVVLTALPRSPADATDEGPYLVASPRTRYNGYPLPGMSLSATVSTADGTPFDDYLGSALGSDLGYHYGAVVEGLHDATEVTLRPTLSPQVARHEGYETAFFDLPARTVTL